jgi:hypothetical protein
MGCFTVPCGLSGIPIVHNDPIIGFNVEPVRYDEQDFAFTPTNVPILGKYNDYGSLEDKNGNILRSLDREELVLCHVEMWEQASKGYDAKIKGYRGEEYITLKEYFERTKKTYQENVKKFNPLKMKEFTPEAIMQLSVMREKEGATIGLHVNLKRLLDKSESQSLRDEWNKRIIDGNGFTDKEFELLSQLCMVYRNIYNSGRQVTPTSHCWTMQDSDCKKEAEWHKAVSNFCTKKAKKTRRN